MQDDIKLLPLPEWMSNYTIPADDFAHDENVVLADRMRDYARANVEHHTEALRAEVVLERNRKADAIHACALANIRAERLAEALAELISWVPSADTYRRLGFDPEAPMRVLEEARSALAQGQEEA